MEYLTQNPASGKDFNHIRKNYRCSKVKSHLIFYRITEKQSEIEIIRVLHQKMHIANRLND
jgi:toxin ParE1/3/4